MKRRFSLNKPMENVLIISIVCI